MKLVLALVAVAALLASGSAAAFGTGIYTGTGQNGAVVFSTTQSTSTAIFYATTFTVQSGVTLTPTSSISGIYVFATESITIDGTLDYSANANTPQGGGLGATGNSGVSLGGTGATTSSGAAGAVASVTLRVSAITAFGPTTATNYKGGGGGGGQSGLAGVSTFGGGGGGAGPCTNGGNGGAAGAVTATGGTGGTGGDGGGLIVLVAPVINIGASGVLKANGENGAPATGSTPNGASGGGGGSGGLILLYARAINEAVGASYVATGGTGGTGGGTGGAGAAGGAGGAIAGTTACTLAAGAGGVAGSSPTNGGGGGGGGGGGMLVKHVDESMVWTGDWSSAAAYTPGDAVLYGGLTYASLTTNTNQQPDTNPDDWTIMGNSGFNSITVNVAESPGVNCAEGGRKITSGLDNGDGGGTPRDDTLQAGEVDSTAYVCDGATGATGPEGPEGDPGPIGITWQGAWDDDVSYAEQDAVHYAGSAWYCFSAPCDDAPSPGSSEWDFIANADGVTVLSADPTPFEASTGLTGTEFAVIFGLIALGIYLWSRSQDYVITQFSGILPIIGGIIIIGFAGLWSGWGAVGTSCIALGVYMIIRHNWDALAEKKAAGET